MWQCPDCGEQHEGQFETCWKCGSNPAGVRDPDFQVSEPVRPLDQAPESLEQQPDPPSLELPAVTYFSIPLFICIYLAAVVYDFPPSRENRSLPGVSPLGIAVSLVGTILIGMPVFAIMIRRQWFDLTHPRKSFRLRDFFWYVDMFRLPRAIAERHRWFVPIYYGSLVAMVVVPFGLAAWRLSHVW